MAVPLLDIKTQNAALREELESAFRRVLDSGRFILGSEVEELENEIAVMCGVKHAIGVSSGTDAILLALMALNIGPGDEVLCPTFTFFATAGCVARTGATPVFVDVDPVSFNIDLDDAAEKVTDRTKAIIPVHLFGQVAEMDGVMALAQKHGLQVIEDGAQSLGAGYRGRPAGSMGHFGTFSFFPSKNLGGFGDSGMLVCNDDRLGEKAHILRTHGSKPKYYHKYIGGNFRLDPLQAALLRVKVPHYGKYTENRQANADYYTENLLKLPQVELTVEDDSNAQGPARILLPRLGPDRLHIWNQYTVRVLDVDGAASAGENPRDRLKAFLADKGIGSEIYYPVCMHQQECFKTRYPDNVWTSIRMDSRYPNGVADRLAAECLSIPIYPELTREQKDEVVAAIAEFLGTA